MTNNKTFLGWIINGDFTPEQANELQRDADVVEEIMDERLRQFEEFGDQSGRKQHEMFTILAEEFGEIAKDLNDLSFKELTEAEYLTLLKNYRNEWLQTAAVAVQGVVAVDKLLERCK